jgi:ligand-binding SRPBCC domain-containing protein
MKQYAILTVYGQNVTMKVKYREWKQVLPKPQEEVWSFFAHPDNLSKLTPSGVGFKMLSDLKGKAIYPGMIIEHRVSPILGIPLYWMTEITQVAPFQYFIDEQRFGPYAFWHHQHHFEAVAEGTLMTDKLHYKVPYGILGTIADSVFVGATIDQIFNFRQKTLLDYFQK